MNIKTLRQTYRDADTRNQTGIKSVDSFTVPFDKLVIEPGHNVRYAEITDESVADLVEAYKAGEPIPPLVVKAYNTGTFVIDAGHRRHKALSQLQHLEEFQRVQVMGNTLNPIETILFMVGENSGKNLNAVDMSVVCGKLRDLDLSPLEIAQRLSVSESKVNYHLTIAKMSDTVKQAILDDRIAADFAVEIFRKSGDQGVLDIIDGKAEKVTRKSAGAWRPSMGKTIVTELFNAPAVRSGDTVTVTLTTEQYDALVAAGKALGGDKS